MRYLITLILFLSACTEPKFVSLTDNKGNPIHTTTPEIFFSSPNQTSEWSFWYFIILAGILWLVWKEFKNLKWPKQSQKEDK
jgi:fucose permease